MPRKKKEETIDVEASEQEIVDVKPKKKRTKAEQKKINERMAKMRAMRGAKKKVKCELCGK